jgi:predicted AAA+ superfamily ATPase
VIDRARHRQRILEALDRQPVVALLGARQVGKTTLARDIMNRFGGPAVRFDLEDPDDLARLDEPKLALGSREGLVVIDEVQRRPDLFPVLRVLVDRPDSKARFLVLGSASPELLRQTSETLAGRVSFHTLTGFSLDEVSMAAADALWLRGGFPRSFLAASDGESAAWRRDFVRTFLERDVPQLGIRIPAPTLRRFWTMIAHYHGQIWRGAELARAFGVAESTVRRYLDVLVGALVIRRLPPWHENLAKRQVRAPKVYIADSGLLHSLLGLTTREDLERHPKVGASWEGFVLDQVITCLDASPEEIYFWATHAGAELDLLVVRGNQRIGVKVKRTTRPQVTRSALSAMESLRLDRLDLVHAGEETFHLRNGIRAVAFRRLLDDVRFPAARGRHLGSGTGP